MNGSWHDIKDMWSKREYHCKLDWRSSGNASLLAVKPFCWRIWRFSNVGLNRDIKNVWSQALFTTNTSCFSSQAKNLNGEYITLSPSSLHAGRICNSTDLYRTCLHNRTMKRNTGLTRILDLGFEQLFQWFSQSRAPSWLLLKLAMAIYLRFKRW